MEFQIIEPDERGWEVVVKDGTIYEKKTLVYENGATTIYDPIPFKKTQNHQYQNSLPF